MPAIDEIRKIDNLTDGRPRQVMRVNINGQIKDDRRNPKKEFQRKYWNNLKSGGNIKFTIFHPCSWVILSKIVLFANSKKNRMS